VTSRPRSSTDGQIRTLAPATAQELADVPPDRSAHTIEAGALGDYRALAAETQPGVKIVLALPLADVNASDHAAGHDDRDRRHRSGSCSRSRSARS
jgi:hypothetical protein